MSSFFPPTPTDSPGTHPPSGGPTYTGKETAFYRYGGWTGNPRENKYDGGLGVYKDDTYDFLTAAYDLGFFAPTEGAGTQFGAKGEMTSFQARADLGTLAEICTLGYANTSNAVQGGVENFFSGEVHGPRAAGEASVGTDGLNLNAGVDLAAVSAKLGGAEYDWFGGTEISAGAGVGWGAGGGISWSDDDQDGVHELGASGGAKWWLGANVGVKTEIPGHLANLALSTGIPQQAGEMVMDYGGDFVEWLNGPEDEGLTPWDPPSGPSPRPMEPPQ